MKEILLQDIKRHLNKHGILLAAFQRINQNRDYYKGLNKEDFANNMDQLFDELETLYDMMFNEDVELRDTLYTYTKKEDKSLE